MIHYFLNIILTSFLIFIPAVSQAAKGEGDNNSNEEPSDNASSEPETPEPVTQPPPKESSTPSPAPAQSPATTPAPKTAPPPSPTPSSPPPKGTNSAPAATPAPTQTPPASTGAATKNELKPKESKATFVVRTNAAAGSVIFDDAELGKVGETLELTAGPQMLTIRTPGMLTRSVWVNLVAGVTNNIQVNTRKAKKEVAGSDLYNKYGGKINENIAKKGSVCGQFPQNGGNPLYSCNRKTWNDDVKFANYGLLPNPTKKGLTLAQQTKYDAILKKFRANSSLEGSWRADAEKLFAEAPEHLGSMDMVLYASILEGNCRRVLELSDYASSMGFKSTRLMTSRAICLETDPDYKETYRDAAYALKTPFLQPDSYFHLARLAVDLQKRNYIPRILDACMRRFPIYFPCYQMAYRYAFATNNRKLAGQIHGNFSRKVIADLPVAISLIADLLRREEWNAAWPLAQEIVARRPDSFEIQWVLVLFALHDKKEAALAKLIARLEATRAGNSQMASQLVQMGEKYEDHKALASGYLALIRSQPQEPYFYWQLAKQYQEEGDRCADVHRVLKEAPLTNPEAATALLTIEGQCYMSEDEISQAVRVFTLATTHSPKDWRGFYNLAIAQERLGAKVDALANFELAAGLTPPADIALKLQQIIKRMAEYRRSP